MCCAPDNHNYMCHMCAKEFLNLSINWAVIFTILPQISEFHKTRNFSSIIICNFLDQLLHPYKFNGRDMAEILFFIFASCEPLSRKAFIYQPQFYLKDFIKKCFNNLH